MLWVGLACSCLWMLVSLWTVSWLGGWLRRLFRRGLPACLASFPRGRRSHPQNEPAHLALGRRRGLERANPPKHHSLQRSECTTCYMSVYLSVLPDKHWCIWVYCPVYMGVPECTLRSAWVYLSVPTSICLYTWSYYQVYVGVLNVLHSVCGHTWVEYQVHVYVGVGVYYWVCVGVLSVLLRLCMYCYVCLEYYVILICHFSRGGIIRCVCACVCIHWVCP